MKDKIKDNNLDILFTGILNLKTIDECYAFFDDLCTVSELKAMEQRFLVARLLKDGYAYHHIVNETGASTATISRVNRSLRYGNDGYKLILERIESK